MEWVTAFFDRATLASPARIDKPMTGLAFAIVVSTGTVNSGM
jgi:hypothetical protein